MKKAVDIKTARLNEHEREFAEKWHNTVYAFLHDRNLSIDEYYDVVIFDYLRAVRNYNRQEQLRQYSFHTIAWNCMDTGRYNYQDSKRRKAKYYTEISLEGAMTESGENLLNVIAANERLDKEGQEYAEFIDAMAKYLTTEQVEQLRHMYSGYTQKECAKILKISKNREYRNRKAIRAAMAAVMMY